MNFSYRLSAVLMGAVMVMVQPQVAVPQTQTVEEQAIANMARDVTVVINGQNPGSGVIIAKQGNTYHVLTAKHVVATQDEYEILTPDAKSYKLNYGTVKKLPGVDLAVVQFTSNQNYRVAQLGDSDQVTEGATVYISGWPHPGRAITQRIYQMTKGSVSGRPLQPLDEGYALVYTNVTRSGMSGGPVLDGRGRIVGIHGRAEGEPVFNPDTGATVDVRAGFNLGIPINSFVKLASQNGINLSYLGDNFTLANKIAGHSQLVSSVAISADGQTLASGSWDNTIKIWNRSAGKEVRTLTGHSNRVNSVALSPDGQTLVSGGEDGTVKIWNLGTGQVLNTLKGDRNYVRAVAISPDGQTLASASTEDANVKIWNLRSGELKSTLKGHSNYLNTVAFSADGQTLASGSSDKTIKLWNLQTGQLLRTLTGHSTNVNAVAFSPYGQFLASGSYSANDIIGSSSSNVSSSDDDATVQIWNTSTGELLHTLKGHSRTVNSVAIDPYGHNLASGSKDGTIKIWSLHTGQLMRTLEVRGPQQEIIDVTSVSFSADGQTLVSGGGAGLRIWQLAKR